MPNICFRFSHTITSRISNYVKVFYKLCNEVVTSLQNSNSDKTTNYSLNLVPSIYSLVHIGYMHNLNFKVIKAGNTPN